MMPEGMDVVFALLVLLALVVVAYAIHRSRQEKFAPDIQRRYGLFDYPLGRYDPALVPGHEVVMFPDLFGGI
jgi:hypothetical protein